jgi:hypothetical protein
MGLRFPATMGRRWLIRQSGVRVLDRQLASTTHVALMAIVSASIYTYSAIKKSRRQMRYAEMVLALLTFGTALKAAWLWYRASRVETIPPWRKFGGVKPATPRHHKAIGSAGFLLGRGALANLAKARMLVFAVPVSGCNASYASLRRRPNSAWFDGELGCGSGAPDHNAEITRRAHWSIVPGGAAHGGMHGDAMNEIAQGGYLQLHLMLGLLITASVIVAWLILR